MRFSSLFANCEVLNIAPGDESVRLTVSEEQVFDVPWVVAADGASSGIRHQLEVETDGPGDMGHFLNVMFRADYGARLEGRRAILYPTFTDDYLEFFVAIDGTDLWLMHHFLQPAETAADFPPDRLQPIVVKAFRVAECTRGNIERDALGDEPQGSAPLSDRPDIFGGRCCCPTFADWWARMVAWQFTTQTVP